MKLIISAVACICLLVGTGLFGKLSDNNITQKKNPKETSNTSASTTTITDTTSKYVTTTKPEPTVTTPSASTLPPVTVIETVLETTTTTPGVTTTTAPPETTVSETSAISNTTAKELKNLKDHFLSEKVDYSYHPITQKLINAGLNEEQVYKIMHAGIFTRFSENIPLTESDETYLGNSEYLSGYSYSSYHDLINYFFTEGATYNDEPAINMWYTGNIDGELKMVGASPFVILYDNYSIKVIDSSESHLEITIDCELQIGELSEISKRIPGIFTEDELKDLDHTDAELISQKLKDSNYYLNFSEIEIAADTPFVILHYDFTEEMTKTDEGWKFNLYQDFRKLKHY